MSTPKLTNGASAPHAHYGLGRDLEARGEHDAALAHLQTAVELYPENSALRGTRWEWSSAISAAMEEATQSLARAQQYGAQWPAVDDPLMATVRTSA